MKLFVAPYQMQLKGGWSRSHSGKGSLIKIENENGDFGYADLHPWETLGDQTIDEQIENLKQNKKTPLSARSIDLALIDLNARKAKINLFNKYYVEIRQVIEKSKNNKYTVNNENNDNYKSGIKNHLLCMSLEMFKKRLIKKDIEILDFLLVKDPKVVKVKMDSIIKNEIDLLYEINSKYPDIFFRLDFNETFSYNSFLDFWNLLSSQIKSRIEYCEDPIPWSVENWLNLHNLGVPLAADRVLDDLMLEVFGDLNKFSLIKVEKEKIFAFIKVFVLKPAKYNLDLLFNLKEQEISELVKNNIKFVVTSYLDHPVGVAHAFVEALKLKKMYSDLLITCGLNSAGAYEKINFNLEENIIKSLNDSTREFGIGFSNLLENQKWIYCGQF